MSACLDIVQERDEDFKFKQSNNILGQMQTIIRAQDSHGEGAEGKDEKLRLIIYKIIIAHHAFLARNSCCNFVNPIFANM